MVLKKQEELHSSQRDRSCCGHMSTSKKVGSKLQSLFTKDTERQTGKPIWRLLFVQNNLRPPQTSQITKQLFPPQPSKINIYKNINKYPPYAYRTYISYN